MPRKNKYKFKPRTQSAKAVSTKASPSAKSIADFFANDKENIREDLAKFLANSIATSPGIAPEKTSYGKALIDMMRDYGNPIINEINVKNAPILAHKRFKPSDSLRSRVKELQERLGKDRRIKLGKTKYYDPKDNSFYEIVPRPNYDRAIGNSSATLNIREGNVDDLLAELAHHVQYRDLVEEEQIEMDKSGIMDMIKHGDSSPTSRGSYGVPGTYEYEAHEEIEPQLIDDFKRRLDSYFSKNKSAMSVEDLFKF